MSIVEEPPIEQLLDPDLEAVLSEFHALDSPDELGETIVWDEQVDTLLASVADVDRMDPAMQRKLGSVIQSALLEESVQSETDRVAFTQARERAEALLVSTSQGLVRLAVGKLAMRPGSDREALIQAGNEGLCRAARSYDPDKGAFSTFAFKEIINAAQQHLAEVEYAVSIPLIAVRQIKIMFGVRAKFSYEQGREPTEEEWVALYNTSLITRSGAQVEREQQRMSIERIRQLLAAAGTKHEHVYRLDIQRDSEPERYVLSEELRGELVQAYERALADMPPRQKQAFELHLPDATGNTLTREEMAAQMQVTPQAIEHLLVKAKGRLRTQLATVDPKYESYRLNRKLRGSKAPDQVPEQEHAPE